MSLKWPEKHLKARALFKDHDEIMLWGGAGSGKTWIILEVIAARALIYPGSRHALLRLAFEHCTGSLWPSFKEMLGVAWPGLWETCRTNQSAGKWVLTFPNGSELWFGGLGEKDKVEKWLSTEFATVYVNEASQIKRFSDIEKIAGRLRQKCHREDGTPIRHLLGMDMNPPGKSSWQYDRYQKNIPEGVAQMKLTPRDNPNLPESYIKRLERMSERQRKRFLDGDFVSDTEGALWTFDMIEDAKALDVGETGRTVIAVDPAVTSNKDSDETGIVVMAQCDHGYRVLADLSGKMTPKTWAAQAVRAYQEYEAECIVVETNQGGDMCRTIIEEIDHNVPVRDVRASKGKWARAEPIAHLYETGQVAHSEGLSGLEDQMCEWVPNNSTGSPDRIDALVWGLTYLSGNIDMSEMFIFPSTD